MSTNQTYTLSEVSSHNTPTDLWMIIDDKVLDVTSFLKEHPGGEQTILDFAGVDGTEAFDEVGHSQDAWDMIEDYIVGVVDESEQKNYKKAGKESKNSAVSFLRKGIDNMDLIVSFGVLASGLFMLYRLRKQK